MTCATCAVCGWRYADMRTGVTFKEVLGWLWVDSTDPQQWKYKRRNTVLGKWHQYKQQLWAEHITACTGQKE